MVAMIIIGVTFYLGMTGVIAFTEDIIISLVGIYFGIFIEIVLCVLVLLSFSGIITVAGLQKNEEGFFERKCWWRKWNEYTNDISSNKVETPNDSCQFYGQTTENIFWSFANLVGILVLYIVTLAINLFIGRVPKFCSFTLKTSDVLKLTSFTEEHCKFSPAFVYGIMGVYLFFLFIGYKAENMNWGNISLIIPAIWATTIKSLVAGSVLLITLWKCVRRTSFWEVAMDLKEAAREKFCWRIVE